MSPRVRRVSVQAADRKLARSVGLVALALYTASFGSPPAQPAAEATIQTARALSRGSLVLAGTPEATRLCALADTPEGAGVVVRGSGAHADEVFAAGGIGPAVAALPLYVAGRGVGHLLAGGGDAAETWRSPEYLGHLFAGWRNALFGALAAQLVVLAALRLGAPRPHAWLGGVSFAATTFAWPGACSGLPEMQVAFFLIAGLAGILRVRERLDRLERPRSAILGLVGASLAGAFLTDPLALPAVAVELVVLAGILRGGLGPQVAARWEHRGRPPLGLRRALVLVLVPVLFGLALQAGLDQVRSGRAWALGGLAPVGDAPAPLLARLLFSPGSGLVAMAPLVVLLPIGLAGLPGRGERRMLQALVVLMLAWLGPLVAFRRWPDGWGYGPRGLLPILPVAWVGVTLGLRWMASGKVRRRIAWAIALVGGVSVLPGVLVDPTTYHDVALQAAQRAQVVEDGPDFEERALAVLPWRWGFASAWAHWRILRHRVATGNEELGLHEVFGVDAPDVVVPSPGVPRGWGHLAWVDLARGRGGPAWPLAALVLLLAAAGARLAVEALDPAAP